MRKDHEKKIVFPHYQGQIFQKDNEKKTMRKDHEKTHALAPIIDNRVGE